MGCFKGPSLAVGLVSFSGKPCRSGFLIISLSSFFLPVPFIPKLKSGCHGLTSKSATSQSILIFYPLILSKLRRRSSRVLEVSELLALSSIPPLHVTIVPTFAASAAAHALFSYHSAGSLVRPLGRLISVPKIPDETIPAHPQTIPMRGEDTRKQQQTEVKGITSPLTGSE